MHRYTKAARRLFLLPALMALASALAPLATNSSALAGEAHPPARADWLTLSFPSDYIVGSLYRLQATPTGYSSHNRRFFANARGDVAVPRDTRFDLKMSYRGAEDLTFMDKLPLGPIISLEFERLSVTDQQLRSLKCLPVLEGLTLTDTDVTDRGFMELERARHLRFLVLKSTLMTGKGLPSIHNLKTLESLDTEQNRFSDESLSNLSHLNNLRLLRLKDAHISDAGLKYIAKLPALSELSLSVNRVTDKGVEQLIGLKNLHRLNLTDTKVTVKCLDSLEKIPQLERLSISFCDFTPQQLAQFKRRLHCVIIDGRNTGTDLKLFSPLH